MKLLELLIKELPARGGWPAGMLSACQSLVDREIYFYPALYKDGDIAEGWADDASSFYPRSGIRAEGTKFNYLYVTKDQYEKEIGKESVDDYRNQMV